MRVQTVRNQGYSQFYAFLRQRNGHQQQSLQLNAFTVKVPCGNRFDITVVTIVFLANSPFETNVYQWYTSPYHHQQYQPFHQQRWDGHCHHQRQDNSWASFFNQGLQLLCVKTTPALMLRPSGWLPITEDFCVQVKENVTMQIPQLLRVRQETFMPPGQHLQPQNFSYLRNPLDNPQVLPRAVSWAERAMEAYLHIERASISASHIIKFKTIATKELWYHHILFHWWFHFYHHYH